MRNQLTLALLQLQRYALGIVHVDTGRLKNSIFTELESRGNDLLGYVATNVEYAPFEEFRGGGHAFFGRTVKEEGPHVANSLFRPIVEGR
jgi:phage gpG-like protein